MDPELKREFKRLNDKIAALTDLLIKAKTKETWVGPSWIMELTGWDKVKLRKARDQGIIKFAQKNSGAILYVLESIPEVFILKP
jgi:hypothetical protein